MGFFMTEKLSTTTILKRQLQWMKAMGIRIKTVRCDNAKEQTAPLKGCVGQIEFWLSMLRHIHRNKMEK
jgi:hypothetical protein